MLKCFKRHGADISSGTMAAPTVVVNFNIFKHRVEHLFASGKPFTVGCFHLQTVKEAFSTGIVVAVALAAHAADQLVFRYEILVGARTVLAATIGMQQDTFWHFTPPERHLQGFTHKLSRYSFSHGPANNQP